MGRDTQGAEGDPDKIDASRVLTLKSVVTLATELTRRTSTEEHPNTVLQAIPTKHP